MDVLLDMTPLNLASRYRGIGMYVLNLGQALAALSSQERQGLEIRSLIELQGPAVVGGLQWQDRRSASTEGRDQMRWIFGRRTVLVPTLRRLRPGLFHVTESLGTPRGSFVPRVNTCHDLLRHELHREYLAGRPIYRRLLQMADASRYHSARRVIAISEHTADSLVRILRLPAKRIDVIPHGVNTERFHPPRDEAEQEAQQARRAALDIGDKPYATYIGGADWRKSVPTLIRAFGQLPTSMDVELVLAGYHTTDEKLQVDAALAEIDRPDRVVRLGFVEESDIVAILAGAQALAFPSIGEGFGLPVLEAMGAGCPVITTSAMALAEVAGDAALIVPPRDEPALTQALRRVFTDQSLGADLRRAGLARAARFRWRDTALATVDTYCRALG
ncbi:MAG: glycosyltransferase family 4 protein [Deltaproteobacteria bacterium]|nr:glycosyltransferase family 4 protein [Deltaproteobacteria bacterium]